MSKLRIALPLLLAAVLTAVLPFKTGSAEAPKSLLLSYDMWEGGLHALSLETRMNRGDSAYSVKFSVRTRGLAWLVHPFSLKAQTDGIADEQGLRPLHYRSTSEKRGKTRRQEITYLEDGSLDVRREPKKTGKRKKNRVPEDLTSGTLDPASALLSIIDAFARAGRCEGSIPVYDGRRRYDLLVTQTGSRSLKSNGYGMYSGPATVCRIAVEQLAGFKKKRQRKGRFPSVIDVWLAPLAGGDLAVPVRLEGKTDRGKMILHLVEARHREPVERAAR